MFSLEIASDPDRRDLLIADLWDSGCAGISELDNDRLRVFFEDTVDRSALLNQYPGSTLREEQQLDWVQSARDLLQPMSVGRRFFLIPEWRDEPTPPGRFRIAINPGMAFGTGIHETTQLCLEALEDYLQPGMTMVDIGTGSGILAEAARLLGAGSIFACDIDPDAVEIARRRVDTCFAGSADAVRGEIADLIVANISPEAIFRLGVELLRVLRRGGLLLASGFESHEVEQIQAAMPTLEELRQKGAWALAVIRRS
jgi:ribosomal protein L11 methyltransferase